MADMDRLVKIAKIRSAVLACVNAAAEPMGVTDLWVKLEPEFTELDTNKDAFTKIVESMAKNNQVVRIKAGHWIKYADKSTAKAAEKPPPVSKNVIDLDNVTIAEARNIYIMLKKMFGHEKL